MRDKYIKIVVSGLPKTGKTTVAELIGDALAKIGFDVSLETDAESSRVPHEAIQAVLRSGIEIHIQERDASTQKPEGRKNSPPAPKGKPEPVEFPGEDMSISCIGCGTDFLFSAGEQEWFKSKDLDQPPKRCKQCLTKKIRHNNHANK